MVVGTDRQPVVRLSAVTKCYTMGDETVHALNSVDLEIVEGE
jgi:hypothetical protein